ncbi:DMT family transporter [Intestinibacter bartlettii]|uniref:DMT family transporter n=1 Tax=Intestinibacter bartlettii TaxID=261299 RepID=UPI00352241ED
MNKATIKVLIAMLLWGSLGVFVKNISLDSVEIAFFRGIIGSVFLGIVLLIRMQNNKKLEENNKLEDENKKPGKKGIIILIISGMAIGLNWVFLFNSYNYITVANATIVYYLAPVIVIFVSPIFLKEKLTLKKVLSVICAMIGLVLIVRTGSSNGNVNLTQGIINAFAAACLYASVIILNKFIKNVDDYTKTFIQLFMASMVLLPWVIFRNNILFDSPKSIILIAILGIAHTGIAYCLYFSAMKELKAQSIAILGYLDPVSSVVFSIFLLKEPFFVYQLIGGVIILASAIIAEKNPKPKTIENGEINL